MMDKNYTLNDLATMTGFSTRTLRTYLTTGLLEGEKVNGVWQFSPEDLDRFFSEPFVKEGLRIKRSAAVYDFLAETSRTQGRACTVLDLPVSLPESRRISEFFCEQMKEAHDATFSAGYNRGILRIILTGAEDQVRGMMQRYYETR